MHVVSDDEGSLSLVAAVPASQIGRDCGRVAVAAPQRRRLKLVGGSQDTTVGRPSNISPVLSGHVLRSAGSSVPPNVMPEAVDISTPRDRRQG